MRIYTYAICEDMEYEGPYYAYWWSPKEYTESEIRRIVFEVSAHFGASVTIHDNAYHRELARVMAEYDLHRFVPLHVDIDTNALRGYFPFSPGAGMEGEPQPYGPTPIVIEDEPRSNS